MFEKIWMLADRAFGFFFLWFFFDGVWKRSERGWMPEGSVVRPVL